MTGPTTGPSRFAALLRPAAEPPAAPGSSIEMHPLAVRASDRSLVDSSIFEVHASDTMAKLIRPDQRAQYQLFLQEPAFAGDGSTPSISVRAAPLIGHMLGEHERRLDLCQAELLQQRDVASKTAQRSVPGLSATDVRAGNNHELEELDRSLSQLRMQHSDSRLFGLMAARLSPERYGMEGCSKSKLAKVLEPFVDPGAGLESEDVERLLKTLAQTMGAQLEHFQLLHDAALEILSPGDQKRGDIARSQKALGRYAAEIASAIPNALERGLVQIEERLDQLAQSWASGEVDDPEEGCRMIQATGALDEAKQVLTALGKTFEGSPEALRIKTAVKHARLDAVVEELTHEHDTLSGLRSLGPVVPAAIAQAIASFLHLGEVRTPLGAVTEDDTVYKRAAVIGSVSGFAHQSINNLVKPVIQHIAKMSGAAEKLNMVPLKAADAGSLIPPPLQDKNEGGQQVAKTAIEMAREEAQVAVQRAIFEQKKVQANTTHPLGEMIPFGFFGGYHAVRELMTSLQLIQGRLQPSAITSGLAGGSTAALQSLIQQRTYYTDPKGRRSPVFVPDRGPKSMRAEIVKGLDPLKAEVRGEFYSKMTSSIQSAFFTNLLPKSAVSTPGKLSGLQIAGNSLLAALGSITYLSSLYASQSVGAETKVRKAATGETRTQLADRTTTAFSNIFESGRATLPHTFGIDSTHRVGRRLETAYHSVRGALQVMPQLATDLAIAGDAALTEAITHLGSPRGPAADVEQQLPVADVPADEARRPGVHGPSAAQGSTTPTAAPTAAPSAEPSVGSQSSPEVVPREQREDFSGALPKS